MTAAYKAAFLPSLKKTEGGKKEKKTYLSPLPVSTSAA